MAVVLGVAQAAKNHRECGEPEVGFRLAATGGKEEKIDDLALWIRGIRDAGQIQQHEGELEYSPTRRINAQSLLQCAPDRTVRQAKGIEGVGVLCKSRNPTFDAVRGDPRMAQQLSGCLCPIMGKVPESGTLVCDPPPVLIDKHSERRLYRDAIFDRSELEHP